MNVYLDRISQISEEGKYLKWYCSIINNALNRAQTKKQALLIFRYVEGHHILPKCMAIDSEKTDGNNLVYLSSREHILVHWLMIRMFENTNYYKRALSMLGAFLRVTKSQSPRKASYIYKTSLLGECISKANKGRVSANKGKKHTAIAKSKMSKARRGKRPANYDLFIMHAVGKIYVNNGIREARVHADSIPEGYIKGPLYKKCTECGYTTDVRNFQKYHKNAHITPMENL